MPHSSQPDNDLGSFEEPRAETISTGSNIQLRTPQDLGLINKENTTDRLLHWLLRKWRLCFLDTNDIPRVTGLFHYHTFLAEPDPRCSDVYLLTGASTSRSWFKHWSLLTQGHCYHLSVQDAPQETSMACLRSTNSKGLRSYLKHEDYSTSEAAHYKRIVERPGSGKLFHAYTVGTCKTSGAMIFSVLLFVVYLLILLQVRRIYIHQKFYLLPNLSSTA